MFKPIKHTFKYGQHTVSLETGVMARQATSSVLASMDDTSVLVTVVGDKNTQISQKFFPLTINYQERTYAAGRIPGGFFRREGRPSENEILIARLIDRPLRPLFPKDFYYEVQIIATVVSVNPQINPDIISIIGASAALCLLNLSFYKPIGAARIGLIDGKYFLNPTIDLLKNSLLDLVVSGTEDSILMVESESKILTEKEILKAISFGHESQKIVIENILEFFRKSCIKKPWLEFVSCQKNIHIYMYILDFYKKDIKKSYLIPNKIDRNKCLKNIKKNIIDDLLNLKISNSPEEIEAIIMLLERNIVRKNILKKNIRIDGRGPDDIRSLDVRAGILPRVHGSSLFTRGETQALVTTTLGTSRDAQNLDELLGDRTDNFLFHYNFPSYSVGEIGLVGSPKRREIGHGRLAKRSLLAVMPKIEKFPYTIRVVSEITESNGSSSMASVCGASLALMDAGVPIQTAIAGIAIGLIKEKNNYIILSDILGEEDYLGDMDLKVAGSKIGITSLQLDIKSTGISIKIIKESLLKAKLARLKILQVMEKALHIPRSDISRFAPRIHTIKINPEKIKDVIGKGGSVIRMLTEETGTTIEIKDDGTVKISATIGEKAKYAISRIREITEDVKIGKIYSGKVTKIVEFGAFVSIGIGKEGLLHISQISNKRVEKVKDYLKIDQLIVVKVLEIDKQGRLRLSMKDI